MKRLKCSRYAARYCQYGKRYKAAREVSFSSAPLRVTLTHL